MPGILAQGGTGGEYGNLLTTSWGLVLCLRYGIFLRDDLDMMYTGWAMYEIK
jgi:hypothetical protein